MQKKISLRTFAYSFFLLFFSAFLILGVLVVYKTAVPNFEKQIFAALIASFSDNSGIPAATNDIADIFKQLQYRVLWTLLVCLLASSIIFFLIIHIIFNRLDNIKKVAVRMTEGHLDETILSHQSDEIGAIGKVINDFAANLQEVLLLLWNQTQNCLRQLNQVEELTRVNPEETPRLDDKLQQMRHGLEDMQTMIRSFHFFGVCIDDGRLTTRKNQEKKFPNPTGGSND
ncbi:MAG: HAMP domain-containing protein [Desulfobacterales bacterium]